MRLFSGLWNRSNVVKLIRRVRLELEVLEERAVPSTSPIDLGTAANYAVLGLQNSSVNNSNVKITGNEAVSQGGKLVNMAPSTITGNVYEYASGQYSGPGKLGGSVVVDPTDLTQADTDALNASTQDAALTPTQTFGTISTLTTVNGNGGVNVININGNITASLILNGTANDVFIVNVSGTVKLGGNSALGLAGGVTADHVLYNFTGTNGTISSKVGNVFNGTLLAPNYNFNLDGTFNGEIIGGGTIVLMSGAKVNSEPFSLPATQAPASVSGFVFDQNGIPLAGATITLSWTDSSGTVESLTTTTNAQGAYSFSVLAPGTYTITQTPPFPYTPYQADVGTVGGLTDGTAPSDTVINTINLNGGDNGINYDFIDMYAGS